MSSVSFIYQGIIVPASVLVPLGIAIARYNFANKALKTILVYLIVAGVTNLIASLFAFRHKNNLPLLHFYTIAEFLLLLRFYRTVINLPAALKWIVLLAVLFPIAGILNMIFFQSMYSFNSYTRPLEAIIMIVFSMTYLIRQSEIETATSWKDQPEMFINWGLLLYFSSSLFQFAFANIVSKTAGLAINTLIWTIHASFVMIMYLLFAIGFAKCRN